MVPEEIVDICNQIKNSEDKDFINKSFRILLRQLPIRSHDVTTTTVWRARKTDEDHPEGFDQITDVIYPPAKVTRAGRFNTDGSPVLYATVSNHGCLAEVCAEPGDKVQVAAFTLNPKQKLHCISLGRVVRAHKWNSGDFSDVQKVLTPYSEEEKTSIFLIDSFLTDVFSDDRAKNNKYIHTTVLADVIRNGNDELDAIVYSGVESEGAKNYVINCDAMPKFNIPDIYLIEITKKHPYGFYEWKLLRQRECYDNNGKIIWKPALDSVS
ncbi:RES family NAD+ phosphorylase [Xenorhabdus littoralis]|uniref:RES family NAD+ phosphorylase n=1 Tax=Xenorhabdus littoralis TaxID=2582835 RepID=UPI0029E80B23|nr:RES family NAD+ phosphorylase [Xenorhabdus sp. psl]